LFRVAASAAIAVLVAIPAIQAAPASAAATSAAITGGITVAIDSVSPQTATATSTVVVSGTVTNSTGSALAGLSVVVDSTESWFTTRSSMDDFADSSAAAATPGLVQDGTPFVFSATIPAGRTASWKVEFTSAAAGMDEFGVYGLEAAVISEADSPVATDRTLLPFWQPGAAKLKIAWIWPLIDQPYTQACGWLTSDDLESSLAPGGRLNGLLAAGQRNPGAQLTWAVDPALLGDAQTLSSKHLVGSADCTAKQDEPASPQARTWLSTLQAATDSQQVIMTSYANVDVAALVHRGLISELESAYQLQDVAVPILSKAFLSTTALPAGGIADQSVLTALAAKENIPSVVLNSSEMPLINGEYADDAVSSWASGNGDTISVLLADSTITSVFKNVGTTSPAAQFAVKQRFLAETAMVAAEAPNDPRSLVVSPPETWDPSESLAADLLTETTSAPWLQPVQLSDLAGSHSAESQSARKPLPANKINAKELSRSYLGAVSKVASKLSVYSSMLVKPPNGYKAQLAQALAATESSAWRDGDTSAQGMTLVNGLNQYLDNAENRVQIIPTGQISMAGASGLLPVTIQNHLENQTVQVKLNATIVTARGVPSTLTIGPQKLVTIPAGQVRLVKLSVHSAPQGSTTINLSLTDADGVVLPWTNDPPTHLIVNSTRYGQAILLLIAGAMGLLLLSSALRSGRRRLAAASAGPDPDGSPDPHGGGEEHGSPGNVMTSAQDPTEAPDDLADARRWADDT
jgi:hypothetical protein